MYHFSGYVQILRYTADEIHCHQNESFNFSQSASKQTTTKLTDAHNDSDEVEIILRKNCVKLSVDSVLAGGVDGV